MNIVVDDLLVHYEQQGTGSTVLLLHGWGDTLAGLSAIQQSLAKQYQVVSVDLPGFGSSQSPNAVWNLDNYAKFLAAFAKKLDFAPFAIIGHSNGGALAIRSVSIGALTPERLVLIAASGIRNSPSLKKSGLKVVAKVGKAATILLPLRTKTKLRKKLYGVAGSDLLVVEHLQDTFKATVRQDVQADAANITIPTLLIYADNDAAVPIADGQTYHRLIKSSRLEIIEGAGHFVHLDDPRAVNTLIETFLA